MAGPEVKRQQQPFLPHETHGNIYEAPSEQPLPAEMHGRSGPRETSELQGVMAYELPDNSQQQRVVALKDAESARSGR